MLADRSEHGWTMVKEYTTDDLAENSHDEKRMKKQWRGLLRGKQERYGRSDKPRWHQATRSDVPRLPHMRFAPVTGDRSSSAMSDRVVLMQRCQELKYFKTDILI